MVAAPTPLGVEGLLSLNRKFRTSVNFPVLRNNAEVKQLSITNNYEFHVFGVLRLMYNTICTEIFV